jgi:nucleoside-diphosphate-sugar epimerase/2-polyprenyl-3-methyl-5-hydroxy-6-metoxy-1,4-benzoquinol methylase
MRILVIGGCGYIGTYLVDYLNSRYFNVVVVDTDSYTNSVKKHDNNHYINAKFQDLPEGFYEEFTHIILLAGQGSVSNSKDVLNVIDNNVRNFAWLLNCINAEQKLIYASSSSVYGKTDNKEVDEDFNKCSGYEPYNYYDWSKQAIDQLAELSGKEYYSLRFGTVNGFSRNLRNDVMINSMIFNAKKSGKIFVSNHNVNRPILGIRDLSRAIETILLKGERGLSGVYNLNSFNATVGEIATHVSKMCNVPCEELDNYNKQIINFKLQTKSYDFKINSKKFSNNFNFVFNNTLESITEQLLQKWYDIENFQNRIDDKYIMYKMIDKCRVCECKTNTLLNVGNQPLANNYTKYHNTLDYNPLHFNAEEEFPLHLHYCPECYHVQLNCVVNPDKLFKNYLYVSGTSKTLKKYFDEFAIFTLLQTDMTNKKLKVLDIACNDGTQLDSFLNQHELIDYSKLDITTVGVDPAENIYNSISSHKTQHDIYCEFFTESTVDKLKKKYGKFDIIIAQNVFAHIDYPGEFLKYASELMDENSSLYIQTSQKNMVLENQFDTAYHEHLSFFNTNSMDKLCQKHDLVLNNIYDTDIHGTSYIFKINTKVDDKSNKNEVLKDESNKGIYSDMTYKLYNLKCLKYKNDFNNKVIEYKLQDKQVIAFGSTAKSMTVINFCNLNNKYIDFMIDENPLKQNLFTPGSNILVCSLDSLKDISKNCVILITAWNFYKEIKEKIELKLKELSIMYEVSLLNIDTLEEERIN